MELRRSLFVLDLNAIHRRANMPERGPIIGLLDVVAYLFAAIMVLAPLSFVMHGGAMH